MVLAWGDNALARWVYALSRRPLAALDGSWAASAEFWDLVDEIDRIYQECQQEQLRGADPGAEQEALIKEILAVLTKAADEAGATPRSILNKLREELYD